MEYRKDIQGLRALAVILVFIFHLNSNYLPGGFIGVDIFFVISGFLMTNIILSKKASNSFSFISFYKSRIKRIVPAYYFVLLVTSFFVLFIFIGYDINIYRKGLFHSILFNSNHIFSSGENYFGASSIENPLLHTWTLAVEMQLYLFLPILLIFTKTKHLLKIIVLLIITLFAYGTYEIIINNNKSSIYFSLVARTPEFLMGSLLSILSQKGFYFSNRKGFLFSIIGISLILISAFLYNENSKFPGFLAAVPCLGTGLILISKSNAISNFFSKKSLVFFGMLSYSIYLWHWPIMALIRYYYNTTEFNVQQTLIILILTIFLSLLSYYYIENRFRNKKDFSFVLSMSIPSILLIILIIILPKINKTIINFPEEYLKPSTVGMVSHGKNAVVGTFGDQNGFRDIFLTGDSHALVLKEWLDEIAKENGFSFRTVTSDKYLPISGIKLSDVPQNEMHNYRISIDLIPIVKKEIKQSNIILMVCCDWDRIPSLLNALNTLIKELESHQDLILIGTFPEFYKNPIRTSRSIVRNDKFSHEIYYIDNSNLLELISNKPNVYYYDISKNNIFKEAPFFNDTLSYYNEGHMNSYGAKQLSIANRTDFMKFFSPILEKHKAKYSLPATANRKKELKGK